MSFVEKFGMEKTEGVAADAWATAIIKVAVILVVGVVIFNVVVSSVNISVTVDEESSKNLTKSVDLLHAAQL